MKLSYKTLKEEKRDIEFKSLEKIGRYLIIKIDSYHIISLEISKTIYLLII